jgi:acetyl-CoA acetyltransferase family protein
VVDAIRSPIGRGRPDGVLRGVHPVDLLAGVLQTLVTRLGIDPGEVDDVVAGCGIPAREQAGNIARHAVLAAGWPTSVPGMTVDRKCGSSQQALHLAAQAVASGAQDVVVACGVEMMGTVPMRADRQGADAQGPRLRARWPEGLVHQGVSAELIAAAWGFSRDDCDAFAARSQQRAAATRAAGLLDRQIVPVVTERGTVTVDEGIREGTTPETLGRLRPAFYDEATAERFPGIRWVVTAGSSSQVSDGACAALVVSERGARRLGLDARARVVAGAVVGDDPIMMLTGPIPATAKVLARAGLGVRDLAAAEVNEAFAPVVLAWQSEYGLDPGLLNPWGGAIAYGHPVGASGGRLLATLLDVLDRCDGRYGLVTMCEGGGMANATLLQRL